MKIISQLEYIENAKIGNILEEFEHKTWEESLEAVENTIRYVDRHIRNVCSQESIKCELINFVREMRKELDRYIEERYKIIKETEEDVRQAKLNDRVDEDTIKQLRVFENYLKENDLLKALGEIRKEIIRVKKETKEYAPCIREIECEECEDFDKCMELLSQREAIYMFTNYVRVEKQ